MLSMYCTIYDIIYVVLFQLVLSFGSHDANEETWSGYQCQAHGNVLGSYRQSHGSEVCSSCNSYTIYNICISRHINAKILLLGHW